MPQKTKELPKKELSVSSEELPKSEKSKDDSFIAQNLAKVQPKSVAKVSQELKNVQETFEHYQKRHTMKSMKINQ